jgi:tRNA G18 (ribose-2'-O)-methylase SpoU
MSTSIDHCGDGSVDEDAAAALEEAAVLPCDEYTAFAKAEKNTTVCVQKLVSLCQTIEREWNVDIAERRRLLLVLRACLRRLAVHRDAACRRLAWLAPKMKNLALGLPHFMSLFLPIERQWTRGLRDDEFLVTDTDKVAPPSSLAAASGGVDGVVKTHAQRRAPLVVIVDNVRSAFNCGAIFRTAECIGVAHLFLCGFTNTPEDDDDDDAAADVTATSQTTVNDGGGGGGGKAKTKKRKKPNQTARTTMGTHRFVSWSHHADVFAVLEAMKQRDVPVVAMETSNGSVDLHNFAFPLVSSPSFTPPPNATASSLPLSASASASASTSVSASHDAAMSGDSGGAATSGGNGDGCDDGDDGGIGVAPDINAIVTATAAAAPFDVTCALLVGNERYGVEPRVLRQVGDTCAIVKCKRTFFDVKARSCTVSDVRCNAR